MSNTEARASALVAGENFELEPTSLFSYQSAGKVVVLGDEAALRHCDDLPVSIDVLRVENSGPAKIEGYLGAFEIELADAKGNTSRYRGDAIVDLNETALLAREMPPPGYFHAPPPSWDEIGLVQELENITGEFDKPKYFRLRRVDLRPRGQRQNRLPPVHRRLPGGSDSESRGNYRGRPGAVPGWRQLR